MENSLGAGRTDSGGLTRVGAYIEGPDRSRSRGVGKLLMRLTHLVVSRRVYFCIKTDCAASRNERFRLVIRGLCEKWYFRRGNILVCVLTISRDATVRDKHAFETWLPVTVAVLIPRDYSCIHYLKERSGMWSLLRCAKIDSKEKWRWS